MHMGQLGHLNHFRCRNCGTDFSMNGDEPREHMPRTAVERPGLIPRDFDDEEKDEEDVDDVHARPVVLTASTGGAQVPKVSAATAVITSLLTAKRLAFTSLTPISFPRLSYYMHPTR